MKYTVSSISRQLNKTRQTIYKHMEKQGIPKGKPINEDDYKRLKKSLLYSEQTGVSSTHTQYKEEHIQERERKILNLENENSELRIKLEQSEKEKRELQEQLNNMSNRVLDISEKILLLQEPKEEKKGWFR